MLKKNFLYLYFGQKRRFDVKLAKKGNLNVLDTRAKNTVTIFVTCLTIVYKTFKGHISGEWVV